MVGKQLKYSDLTADNGLESKGEVIGDSRETRWEAHQEDFVLRTKTCDGR